MVDDARVWNLDHILPLDQFDATFKEIEDSIPKAVEELAKLSPEMSAEEFRAFCERDEANSLLHQRLSSLPELAETVDKDDQETQERVSRVIDLGVRLREAERPISFWLRGKPVEGKTTLDDENAKRLFAAVPDEEYGLHRGRELAKYLLSLKEEDLCSAKDANLATALTDVRKRIELNQRYRFKPQGASRAKTIKTTSEIVQFVESPKAEEREAAYRSVFDEFTRNEELYFPIYSAVVKDWADVAQRRGYASPISMRNSGNDIPDESIETLMRVCNENAGIFQEYFRWKAAQLGVERLRRFDLYAPLETVENDMTLDEGIAVVLDTFGRVSTRFRDHAKRIIDDGHIHSHPDIKKRSGAFCATIVPDISPYILLNWTGKDSGVSTVAHELGHGVHSLYAAHHGVGTQQAPLPLAETASTFAESVLFDRQLEEATSDAVRASMLSEKISESYATIIRQNNFVRFELMAHERIPKGITRDELSELWLGTLHDQFGDSVDVDPMFRHEWAYIPHIVESPFYCYAYSFGELLSLSLYNRYRQDPSYFTQIERILEAGGAENPDAVLKHAGVDMRDPAFWQGSFDIIRGWQERLETYGAKDTSSNSGIQKPSVI